MTTADERLKDRWRERLTATGKAQARYLWIPFVTGLFYASIDNQVAATPDGVPELPGPLLPG